MEEMTLDEVFDQHRELLFALMETADLSMDPDAFKPIVTVLGIYARAVPPATHLTMTIPVSAVIAQPPVPDGRCVPDCGGYADYAAVPCPNPACADRVSALMVTS